LLDDLAARFVAAGWSFKWLHREILLSAAWQQSTRYDAASDAIDPDNRLLWRMNRRRLEIEAWRDAMLTVNGTLDRKIGGPALKLDSPENHRRTLYGLVKRRELDDMLRLNDFPDPLSHSPSRDVTTTPLQQLFVLNSPFMEQQARALIERLKREEISGGWTTDAPGALALRVEHVYRLLYGRAATDAEIHAANEFLTAGDKAAMPTDELWRQYAQALLAGNEFLFID
jgi:hypothetical protein